MEPRLLAQGLAAGRALFGVAMLVAPGRVTASWVGPRSDRPFFAPVTRGFGMREIGLGTGALLALRGSGDAKPWLALSAAGDLTDLVAGLAAGRHLPRTSLVGVSAMAGGATLLGAWLTTQDL